MIILRNKIYSEDESENNLDSTSKKYLAGAAGLAGTGGYLVGTSGSKTYRKKVKSLIKSMTKSNEKRDSESLKLIDSLVKKGITDESVINNELVNLERKYHVDRNQALKKLKNKLENRKLAGRTALVGAAGLTAAAGYRYYKNKNKK